MIQVYGRFDGWWSHAQVSRGIVEGLHTNGVRLRVFNVAAAQQPWAVDPAQQNYEGLPDDIEIGCDPEARVGFYVGGYPPMMDPWLDGHEVKVALFITESSTIPPEWGLMAQKCDLVIVPSAWVAAAYARAGVNKERLLVVQHGLHPIYRKPREPRPPLFDGMGGQLRRLVLGHVCGALSFPERKGLPQLVEAFKRVFKPGEAKLVLRTAWSHEVAAAVGGPAAIKDGWLEIDRTVEPTTAMSPQEMRRWLLGLDALVQPSRAEAFGMVPLEARALGVPVMLTAGTGHLEHLCPDDVSVPVGENGPIVVNGIPNGTAPTLRVEDVVEGLQTLRERLRLPELLEPGGYYEGWSWPTVTRELARTLKNLLKWGKTLEEKAGF